MLSYIRRLFSTKEKKILLENFLSLSFLQAANYVLPLITLPYLVRVLGPDRFGLLAFAQAFVLYFVMLTDYGFNLSATREVSVSRGDTERVSEIFNAVLAIKLVLLGISLLILAALVSFIPKFRMEALVYYYAFGIVIGQVMFPQWFYQGIERMKYITVLNIIGKTIFTVSIFIFIRAERDYIYVPLLVSLGFIVSGAAGLWIAFTRFNIRPRLPGAAALKHQLSEGWHIFISTAAINVYTTSNTVILGFFASNVLVGYYSAGERLIRAFQKLLIPVSQAIYPYISKLAHESKARAVRFLKKVFLIVGGGSLLISVFLFIFARPIVNILLGPQYQESILILRIMAILPFMIGLSNVLGVQTMLTFNMKKPFSKILISASILNIICAFILAPLFQHKGIAVSVVIAETFVTISMMAYLHKTKIFVL